MPLCASPPPSVFQWRAPLPNSFFTSTIRICSQTCHPKSAVATLVSMQAGDTLGSTYPWWPLWYFPPEGLPVDRTRIKQAFLSLPIAEAFQHLFLDQNIEQGWIHCLPSYSHNDCWHRKIILKITSNEQYNTQYLQLKQNCKVLYVYKLWLFLVLYFLHSDIFEELVDIYHHGWALDIH